MIPRQEFLTYSHIPISVFGVISNTRTVYYSTLKGLLFYSSGFFERKGLSFYPFGYLTLHQTPVPFIILPSRVYYSTLAFFESKGILFYPLHCKKNPENNKPHEKG